MSLSEERAPYAVACQGTEGAYSYLAARRLYPEGRYIYFRTFDAVARAVKEGMCDVGVLPIENNTYGSVKEVYRVLARHRVFIVRGLRLPVNHVLLAQTGTSLSDVEAVYSHEQAIGQCGEFLHSLGDRVKVIPALNTAVAAREVASLPAGSRSAAIASPECAPLYGLQILKRHIADSESNYTRFVAVGPEREHVPGANRVSLMLTLPHRVGSLAGILARFADAGLNLLRIESAPIPGRDFEFLFYIDVEAPGTDGELAELCASLEEDCPLFTFLGKYPDLCGGDSGEGKA